ncbi:hypothetical protein FIBSPDRAFT_853601 [Athelia psychrophila]|uniref:Gfo/Idh/MocA-like oxidoreductase C-terminal domain-containing protein n=1 Tax=Athelia psychrophila TaxID=1759441 RepID=A0A166QPX4_9AGAM|nr:hypothetical protein FIBSPDRAFT_853601 [Fibularhizoctonia sp. CBS 109695]
MPSQLYIINDHGLGKVIYFNSHAVDYMDKTNMTDHQGGFAVIIRTSPITHIPRFASFNKDYLTLRDTTHTILRCADGSHGIIELSVAAPFPSLAQARNGMTMSSTSGQDVITIIIRSVTEQKNWRGVECELKSFLNAIAGEDDGLADPLGALRDVAIIQAALNSQGKLVDLDALISQ